jgi:hypothetical protein
MSLIIPAIMPDEIDRGYFGRIMRANGISNEAKMLSRLAERAGMAGLPRRDSPVALLVGMAAYGESKRFVQNHTMLPLRRSITSYLPDLDHGCDSNLTVLSWSALRSARPGAYFCVDCVHEDMAFHGFSYWRREHQTPGLYWCPKHGARLRYREESRAFLLPPSTFSNDCHLLVDEWIQGAEANGAIQRFLAISADLQDLGRPIDVRKIQPVLRAAAARHGYQTSGNRTCSPLLSDAIVKTFGREWLATVLPVAAGKREGELLTQLDGVLFLPRSASAATAYILVLALLYPTPNEAMDAILNPGVAPVRRSRRSPSRVLCKEELRRAYLDARGVYAAIASSVVVQSAVLARRLTKLGLPNLASNGGRLEAAARLFLIEGKSIAKSAEDCGITIESIESMLRIVGHSYAELLREMDGPISGLGSGPRRPLKLTPREVTEMTGRVATKFSSKSHRGRQSNRESVES